MVFLVICPSQQLTFKNDAFLNGGGDGKWHRACVEGGEKGAEVVLSGFKFKKWDLFLSRHCFTLCGILYLRGVDLRILLSVQTLRTI